jgi:CheY-like chemotaxis protein
VRFDLVFCSVRLPGMNWLEFFEHVRTSVGAFVLMTEGYDSDLARAFHSGDGYILRKPVDEKELDLLLEGVEERAEKGR